MTPFDTLPRRVQIHEVGPRDGLQMEATFVPTDTKIEMVNRVARTGVASVQVTSLVHPRAVPQLTDAEEVMSRIDRVPGVRYTVLVPNLRGAERAVPLRADEWELMLSVSEAHSRSNSNRSVDDALKGMEPVVRLAHESGVEVRGGMATALGCPFEGRVPRDQIVHVVDTYRAMGVRRVGVADTVGVADPRHVFETVSDLRERFPDVELSLHLHNTRDMALANLLAGLQAGITSFDTSIGGLGGCPFAPGATGNLCTEDAVHMLQLMGVDTGADLDALIDVARWMQGVVNHRLESAVLRAGKSETLHPAPTAQLKPAKRARIQS